ncbi:MAG: hypothetical protein GY938_25175 [Ketobacter sp.]|nr:hypothetical protein [Ketobacter sp.]
MVSFLKTAFFCNETGRALLRTFIAKGVSVFGALGLFVVIGQLYGPRGVGVYAMSQSILLGAGILSRRGMDNALIRFVGRDFESPQVRRYLYWAGLRSLWISLPSLLVVIALRDSIEQFFAMPGLSGVLLGIGFSIPFYTWSFLLAGFFKGIRKPATAALQENGAISLIAGALILFFDFVGHAESLGLSMLGWGYLVAAGLIAIQGQVLTLLWVRKQPSSNQSSELQSMDVAEFQQVSISFFVMGMAAFMQSVLSIMIAGKFLGSVELGLFKSAQQIAVSVAFVLMVINAIYPPRFAALYHKGAQASLAKAARSAALLGLVLSSPFLLVCLLVPEWILGLLGDDFDSAALLLRILALAQLVNVATGSVGFLLGMTGYERVMRNIALLCSGIGLLGFFVLTPWLGALGAALALAFVLVAQNVAATVAVWIKLGIWTLPVPNFLVFLRVGARSN